MSKHRQKKEKDEQDYRPRITTYKYSANGNWDLHEAVIIGGKPYFIMYNSQTDKPEIVHEIGEEFRILVPPTPAEYSYSPYTFNDESDLLNVFEAAKYETLDTLFDKAKSIIAKYNDQDDYKLASIASTCVWSYFQDRFATTRYEVLTGGVGSGKSALAASYGAVGYRPVNTTNPTAAVIYRLLGNVEPGQCTMILEEAEKIDQNYEIMAILKTGYTRDGKVDRTNPVTLKPEFFNSFCIKIVVAERSPNQDSGKGVIDRSFVYSCFRGFPQFDIKEVLNPTNTGGPEHQVLRKELNDFRKLLLVYRLIHFKDEIPDINVGITGRDKELIKPTLQLFQGTKTQDLLVQTFQTILDLKNNRKATSLHSALLDVVIYAIPDIDKEVSESDGKVELYAKEFWAELPKRIDGMQDDKKPGEYHSTEFGTLYKGTVSKILHDNFGVESRHTRDGNLLIFSRHTIKRLKTQLNSKIVVKAVNTVKAGERGGIDSEADFSRLKKENVASDNKEIESEKTTPLSQEPSQPSQLSPVICQKCSETLDPDPFYQRLHSCQPE